MIIHVLTRTTRGGAGGCVAPLRPSRPEALTLISHLARDKTLAFQPNAFPGKAPTAPITPIIFFCVQCSFYYTARPIRSTPMECHENALDLDSPASQRPSLERSLELIQPQTRLSLLVQAASQRLEALESLVTSSSPATITPIPRWMNSRALTHGHFVTKKKRVLPPIVSIFKELYAARPATPSTSSTASSPQPSCGSVDVSTLLQRLTTATKKTLGPQEVASILAETGTTSMETRVSLSRSPSPPPSIQPDTQWEWSPSLSHPPTSSTTVDCISCDRTATYLYPAYDATYVCASCMDRLEQESHTQHTNDFGEPEYMS